MHSVVALGPEGVSHHRIAGAVALIINFSTRVLGMVIFLLKHIGSVVNYQPRNV